MIHIHIVCPYQSTAMRNMSEPLMEGLGFGFELVTISENIDPDADLNYHIPWHGLSELGPTKSKQGMLYTHCNYGAEPELQAACERADFIVAMSMTGKQELIDLGADEKKIDVIYAGHTPYLPRRRNVGIIGYEQPNGRKRSHILIDLCWSMCLRDFHFIFAGTGFEDVAQKMANTGASVQVLGNVTPEKLQDVYGALDLLVVTSYVEGGPLTVLEALSAGVPVIAPPVGYANDLLPEDCIYYSVEGLQAALENFIAPIKERQKQVILYTWELYAKEHTQLFERILTCQPTSTPTENTSKQ